LGYAPGGDGESEEGERTIDPVASVPGIHKSAKTGVEDTYENEKA
jgi:hypothetical protein